MLDTDISVQDAAKLAGMSGGRLWSWRARGHTPAEQYDLCDALSLRVAARLVEFGLPVDAAAAFGWAVKGEWPRIIVETDRQQVPLFLLVRPGSGAEPYEWSIHTPEQVLDLLSPASLTVNLSEVAREVLLGWRDLCREAQGR